MELTQKQLDTLGKIFDIISDGASVREACSQVGIERTWLYRVIRSNEELAHQYEHARSCSADVQFDDMQALEDRVESGTIDPNTFRVMLDSRKWRFARMNKRYNDKHIVDLTANVSSSTTHTLTADAQSLLDKLIK